MATQGPSVTIVLELVKKMLIRARLDGLATTHPMQVRANELHDAYQRRFLSAPPDCSVCHFVDCFKRAYAAWHTHTGEES